MKTTKNFKEYWRNRKLDWRQSYLVGVDEATNTEMWNHPHREFIIWALSKFKWFSLWEVGVGAGANLMKIVKHFKDVQLGGSDINPDAVKTCQEVFKGGRFHCESLEDLMMSNDSVDVILSDATLLYVGPWKIKKVLNELKRVSRGRLVLCELHSENWLKRWLYKLKSGYNVHNYRKLLESLGAYDIEIYKIPKDYWPGEPWSKFGYIISCNFVKLK